MKDPKEYRKQIYGYIEGLLGRSLTYEEHDDLRDMMMEYAAGSQSLGLNLRQTFCIHDWISDRKIEGGRQLRAHVKCRKCDKRAKKKVPPNSIQL